MRGLITWLICLMSFCLIAKEPEPTNSPGRSIIVTTNMLNGIQLYPGYITFTNCNLLNSNLMSLGTAIWASNTAYWSSNALVNGASLSNALHIGNNAYSQDILGVNNLYSYNSVVSNYLTLITNLTLGVTPMTTAGATEDDFLLKTITGDYYYNNSPLYSYTNLVSGNTNYNVGEWSTYNSSLPHWVKITPGVSYALGTFKILPNFNVHSYLKTFMISGSVDNVNWVQIYSNQAPDVQGWYTAATTNTVNYTYYWFTIAGPIWTGENYTRLISIQGYNAVTGTVYSVVVVPYGTSPSLFDVTSWNTVGAVSNTAAWASNNVHSWASNANVSAMASNATYATTANTASNLAGAFKPASSTNADYATWANTASNIVAGYKPASSTNSDYATTANTASNVVAGYKPASATNSDYATTANVASNVTSLATNAIGSLLLSSNNVWTGTNTYSGTQVVISSNLYVNGILYGATNYCMVYLSTNVNVAQGVYTKVPYDTVITNIGGGWSTANRYFKPNVKGIYYVSACVQMGPASTSALYWMIYKNGSILYDGRYATSATEDLSTMSCLVSLNGSSDYLEVYGKFYNATGIYPSDHAYSPFFCAFLLQKEP